MDSIDGGVKPRGNLYSATRRDAFTVLELLVSLAIVASLIALLLPAVMYARESARRTICTSQMRELGIALHSYHDSRRQLPRAWDVADQDPTFAYGWASRLLPEIEQSTTQRHFDFDKRPSHVALNSNEVLSLPFLLCPSDITEPVFELREEVESREQRTNYKSTNETTGGESGSLLTVLPTANYVGVFGTSEADDFDDIEDGQPAAVADGSVIHDRRVRFADLRRGLSQTLLVGERTMATVPSTWLGVDLRGEDAPCRLVGSAMTRPNCAECDECEFSSRHTQVANFLWADGHVEPIDESVETAVYQEFAKRNAQ